MSFLVLGEAPGQDEVIANEPFVGPAGQELARMFRDAGLPTAPRTHRDKQVRLDIDRTKVPILNVFTNRPPSNDLKAWCMKKDEAVAAYASALPRLAARFPDYPWPKVYSWPALTQGGYLDPDYLSALPKLRDALRSANPNVVLALGNTAIWAVLGETGISKLRGVTRKADTAVWQGKVLATYHPAAVLRQYNFRTVALADLIRLSREFSSAEINHTSYTLIVEPTWEEVLEWWGQVPAEAILSVDIETSMGQVTCVGFSDGKVSICIPILNLDKTLYWGAGTPRALAFIHQVCVSQNPKVFQNGLYDMQYLSRKLGIPVLNVTDDTMLLAHTLQPEMPKGLAFLASVYTNAAGWKQLSSLAKFKHSEGKKDE